MNTRYANWADAAEAWAALETRRRKLAALPPDVERQVKEIERQQKDLKIALQGECAYQGNSLASSHVAITYRSGSVKLDEKIIRYVMGRLDGLAGEYPVLGEMVKLLESAFTRSDPVGVVSLKNEMSEFELRRWSNELKEMAL